MKHLIKSTGILFLALALLLSYEPLVAELTQLNLSYSSVSDCVAILP